MEVVRFFDLFLEELKTHPEMQAYYKFLQSEAAFQFRRAYFVQRLEYIWQTVRKAPDTKIWDCGCGYGTTALFLAMNGIAAHGTTLEFYYKQIAPRLDYWNQFGNANLFTYDYENLFDRAATGIYDQIIVQDTLHHLEPIDEALHILRDNLKPHGELIIIEENGGNLIQNAKLFLRRGTKRIITQWDERLQKNILIGNENIRPFDQWVALLAKNGFSVEPGTLEYIRYYFPFMYRNTAPETLLARERSLAKTRSFKTEKLYFGLNFLAQKK